MVLCPHVDNSRAFNICCCHINQTVQPHFLLHSCDNKPFLIMLPVVAKAWSLMRSKSPSLGTSGRGANTCRPLAQYASPPSGKPSSRGPAPHIPNPLRVVGPPTRNRSLMWLGENGLRSPPHMVNETTCLLLFCCCKHNFNRETRNHQYRACTRHYGSDY